MNSARFSARVASLLLVAVAALLVATPAFGMDYAKTSTIVSGAQYLLVSNLTNSTIGSDPAPTVVGSTLMNGTLGSRSFTANGSFISGNLSSWEFTVISSGSSDNGNPGYLIKSGSSYLDLTQSVTGLCDPISPPIKFGSGQVSYRDYVSEPFSVLSANPRVWFWDGTRFYTKYTSDTKSIGSYVGGSSITDAKWRGYYYKDSTYGMAWVEWNTPWGLTRTDSDGSSQSGARYTNKDFYLMGMRPGYDSLVPSGLLDSTSALSRISGYQLYFGGRQCVAVSASEVGYEYDFVNYLTDFERKSVSLYQRFNDTEPPAISGVPASRTVEAAGPSGAIVSWALPSANDMVDGGVSVSCSPPSGSNFPIGVSTVNVTAKDAAGNTSSARFTVTVSDKTGPSIDGVPAEEVVEATGPGGATVNWAPPTAVDLVDGERTVTCSPASGSNFPLGSTTVSVTSTDLSGNTSTRYFTVTVSDTTGPYIVGVLDYEVAEATGPSGAIVTWSPPTAKDLIDGRLTVTCWPASGSTFPVGVTTVYATAIDTAGNSSTEEFEVEVIDRTPPSIARVPADEIFEATSPKGAAITWVAPRATDLVDGDCVVECSPRSGSTFKIGITTVKVTATDAAGNSATTQFKVAVVDSKAPEIVDVPENQFAEATGPEGAAVTWSAPAATDLLDGTVQVKCTPPSGSTFPLGETTVAVTATDTAGNSASKKFTVDVLDTTPPVIEGVPADVVSQATGRDGAIVTWEAPTAFDIVDEECTVTCSPQSGSVFPVGVTLVTVAATDTAGNEASAQFVITVSDVGGAVLRGVPGDLVAVATGPAGATVKWPTPVVIDPAVGEIPAVCSPPSGSTFPVGATVVTVTGTDSAGNSAVGQFTVTVKLRPLAKIGSIRFPVGSATLTSTAKKQLRSYAGKLARGKYASVSLRGFCSIQPSRSSPERAKGLSLKRAKSANAYLISQFKILNFAPKVAVTGYGSKKPIATNRTKSGQAKNQRVELWAQ